MADVGARSWPAPRSVGRMYYGWVVLGVASLAMVGTLPGRTQGLGLITEPLVVALASAMYGLVASGIGLFNESILSRQGFAPEVYYTALAVTAITGLAGNFAAGAFADRGSLRYVLLASLAILLAAAVAALGVAALIAPMPQDAERRIVRAG